MLVLPRNTAGKPNSTSTQRRCLSSSYAEYRESARAETPYCTPYDLRIDDDVSGSKTDEELVD